MTEDRVTREVLLDAGAPQNPREALYQQTIDELRSQLIAALSDLQEAKKDAERLDAVLTTLQLEGVDGLFKWLWKPFLADPSHAFDRKAIDAARRIPADTKI